MWLNCDTFLITSTRDWSHKRQPSSSQHDPAGQLRCMVSDPGARPPNPGNGNTCSAVNRHFNATEETSVSQPQQGLKGKKKSFQNINVEVELFLR